MPSLLDQIVEEIAKRELAHLGIKDLTVRNRDGLDFHELHVTTIKQMLEAAVLAGAEAGRTLSKKPRGY